MVLEFYKYHGNGNDFIILDNRSGLIMLTASQIARICNRHFGIGADGLMLLGQQDGFDFSLKYFNCDGNVSSMCGNGGRCMTAFARKLGIIENKTRFKAMDGSHEAEILSEQEGGYLIKLQMKDAQAGQAYDDGFFIDTGSPHFIKFVPDVNSTNIVSEGRSIRSQNRFAPGGCNVNFVQAKGNEIKVRTYERGVENETLSCGTGVTASALITALLNPDNQGYYNVITPGGMFKVSFRQTGTLFSEVFLEGTATYVFNGEINI